jgi:hypothetical protein
MIDFVFFDNLLEFIDELYELLKEDWKKFKLFVKENKKNLIWIFIALITLQFTNLIHIGNSCNKHYKIQNDQVQTGGAAPPPLPPPRIDRKNKPVLPSAPASPTSLPVKNKASAGIDSEAEGDKKTIKKSLDKFDELKGKKNKLAKNGLAGPIFSNLDGIYGAVGGIFSLVITILTILGILSLPVLIFIILTYCVIKMILGHLALI